MPRNRGKNTTLIASMGLSGMGESMAVKGATDSSEVFEVYVEHFLAPTLREGQVVVLDGLGAHRPKRIRELIEARGAELVFLPSYSPDLNPIEEAFSKIKNTLRKVGARTHEALWWRRWAGRSARSRLGTRPNGSIIAATRSRFSTCECRREKLNQKLTA